MPTAERLAEFHRVENTYLSTFQTLGGLGLLLGTVGLAAVLLRNVLERRRELALLGAVGYGRGHLFAIVLAEKRAAAGVGDWRSGRLCARWPSRRRCAERAAGCRSAPAARLLLVAVFVAGLVSSIVATRAAMRTPLLDALRAE